MGLFSSGSAKRAAAVQAGKQREAGALVKEETEKASALYDPYAQAGQAAMGQYTSGVSALQPQTAEMYQLAQQQDPIIAKLLSNNMNDYQKAPGYDFRLQQGVDTLQNSAAAKGGLFSGKTGTALTEYGQNYATADYDNYLNRLNNQLSAVGTQLGGRQSALNAGYQNANAYLPVMQQGYNATNAQANIGLNSAGQQAGYITGEGDAYASGMIANSNQILAQGNSILKAAGAAIGSLGGPMGSAIGAGLGEAAGSQPSAFTPSQSYGQQASPWVNPDGQGMSPQYMGSQAIQPNVQNGTNYMPYQMNDAPALSGLNSAFQANQQQGKTQGNYNSFFGR